MSIELALPITGGGRFDIHFGGEIRIEDPAGDVWCGDAAIRERPSLGPVLDCIGMHVTGSHVDSDERLHLAFAGGRILTAQRDKWEAHWPTAPGSTDDRWVPREGPNIP